MAISTPEYTNVILVTASDTVGTTIGVAASAIIYEAGQGDSRFGIGGHTATPPSSYEDASVLWLSSSTYGTSQFGVVSAIETGSITFTSEMSAVSGDLFTKVKSVPSNSTDAFTFPAKSQSEQLRKRLLGY